MIKQIANLIEEYLSEEKAFDKNFVDVVLDNLITDELKPICFYNHVYAHNNPLFDSGYPMVYDYPNGINVYVKNTNKELMNIIPNYASAIKYNFDYNVDNETLIKALEYAYYLHLVIMMSHEVEHVRQNINYNNSDTLEGFITRLNLYSHRRYEELKITRKCEDKEFRNSLEIFYKYKTNSDEIKYVEPIERYANINSTKNINSIINNLMATDEVKEILHFIVEYINRFHLIYSYGSSKDGKTPLAAYVDYLKKYKIYKLDDLTSDEIDKKIIELSSDLSLEERLYNGLEITENEYRNIRSGKIKSL